MLSKQIKSFVKKVLSENKLRDTRRDRCKETQKDPKGNRRMD